MPGTRAARVADDLRPNTAHDRRPAPRAPRLYAPAPLARPTSATLLAVLTLPFMLALTLGGTPSPAASTRVAPSDANAWLRSWLGPLEAESRQMIVGLDQESASTIAAAIDARLADPGLKESMRRSMRLAMDHVDEILRHWPSYQDESARAAEILAEQFPALSETFARAMGLVRSCEWALVSAERERGFLSAAVAALAGRDVDLFAIFDDPTLPEAARSGLRDGLRMSVAATALADLAKRPQPADAELVQALASIWEDGARSYTRMLVSLISLESPGFASRWGLEAHVDPDVIAALVEFRGEPDDPVLGAFADDPIAVDRMLELAMEARRDTGRRLDDA